MTVRLLLHEPKRRWMAVAEIVFLIAGLGALNYYVWINASARMSQEYESWAFTQELQGRRPSVGAFIKDELHPEREAAPAAEPEPSVSAPPALKPALPGLPPSVIGRMEIPRLGLNVMVREGVGEKTLRRAVGHIPATALPGQPGNVALAAHRDTFFRPLEKIKKEDRIQVQTLEGVYEYVVDSIQIVAPKDVWVLRAANQPTLTLVTCYPFHYIGSAPKRFIVRASQVEAAPRQQPPQGF